MIIKNNNKKLYYLYYYKLNLMITDFYIKKFNKIIKNNDETLRYLKQNLQIFLIQIYGKNLTRVYNKNVDDLYEMSISVIIVS